jgi:hypothetical protein
MKRRYFSIAILAGMVAVVSTLASCLITVEIEGDYVVPDSLQMSLVMEVAGEKFPGLEAVKIGVDVYVKDPETQQWMRGEDVEEYEQYRELEDFVLDSIEYILAFEVTGMLGDEDINGISCYHATGAIDPEEIPDSTQELLPEDTESFTAELWIGKSDYLVHQMRLYIEFEALADDPEMPIPAGSYTLTYQFSQFNEPINIEAPELIN